ncbi:MAG: hypothetical protein GOMPHAMPRED_005753 [Gomphillus americanus]|uniref:Antibiotic biosynthesis monooxygenase n=1 Tax=Gomphillus americanus TaxID=1940652 RepID=A0A8H3G0E9_9LECA|nr:MAG: hypothetical protein GOMPHAMPRED_005753 [Gomphillus americanus]
METLSSSFKIPYYAVIFTSQKRDNDGYQAMATRMDELAALQPGYLGVESITNNDHGITISYWQSKEDIHAWKQNLEHVGAQTSGKKAWYQEYQVRICKVERSYGFKTKL